MIVLAGSFFMEVIPELHPMLLFNGFTLLAGGSLFFHFDLIFNEILYGSLHWVD